MTSDMAMPSCTVNSKAWCSVPMKSATLRTAASGKSRYPMRCRTRGRDCRFADLSCKVDITRGPEEKMRKQKIRNYKPVEKTLDFFRNCALGLRDRASRVGHPETGCVHHRPSTCEAGDGLETRGWWVVDRADPEQTRSVVNGPQCSGRKGSAWPARARGSRVVLLVVCLPLRSHHRSQTQHPS